MALFNLFRDTTRKLRLDSWLSQIAIIELGEPGDDDMRTICRAPDMLEEFEQSSSQYSLKERIHYRIQLAAAGGACFRLLGLHQDAANAYCLGANLAQHLLGAHHPEPDDAVALALKSAALFIESGVSWLAHEKPTHAEECLAAGHQTLRAIETLEFVAPLSPFEGSLIQQTGRLRAAGAFFLFSTRNIPEAKQFARQSMSISPPELAWIRSRKGVPESFEKLVIGIEDEQADEQVIRRRKMGRP